MRSVLPRSLLRLTWCISLFSRIVFTLEITYPTQDTVYSASGPWDVQWLEQNGDPSEVSIYLATYTNNKISNYLRCLNWSTDAGSVYITASEGAPRGDLWTWMFYDAGVPLQLGRNQIAESAHFVVNGSTLSPSDSPNSSTKKGLSTGAAAGIAVVVTILVVILCAVAAFFLWYRPRQKNRKAISIVSTEEGEHVKPELEGRFHPHNLISSTSTVPTAERSPPLQSRNEMEDIPYRTSIVPARPELSSALLHETNGENMAHRYSEMPTNRWYQGTMPNELPSSAPVLAGQSRVGEPSAAALVRRKEVPRVATSPHDQSSNYES